MSNKWSDEQVQYIIDQRENGKTFVEIVSSFNKKYKEVCSYLSIKKTYYRYRDTNLETADTISALKTAHRAAKSKGQILKENKLLLENNMSQEEFLTLFNDCLKANPIKVHKPVKNKSIKAISRTIVAHLSDTHFQSQIDEEEMGGLNGYGNIEEARRLAFFMREVAGYKLHYRDATDLVLVLNADLLSGIIHDQEHMPLMTTQLSAGLHLLTQAISYLAQQFKKVRVVCTVGNHGRYMHKTNKGRQSAQKYDSFDTIMHVALRYALKQHINVSFEIPLTPYALIDIQGHKFFITHSDTVFSAGYIGSSINTKSIKDKINDLIAGLGHIDVVMVGHIHTNSYVTLNNAVDFLSNGCASGIDPFAQSLGILKNNPSQQMFEVTKDYAVGDLRSVRLAKADKMEELDQIIKPFEGKF